MQLPHINDLPSYLVQALDAVDDSTRESALAAAWSALASRHNLTGLTEPLAPSTGNYHERPARVLMADRFVDACRATVLDPALRSLPLIGCVDQFVDSTDLQQSPTMYRRLAGMYDGV